MACGPSPFWYLRVMVNFFEPENTFDATKVNPWQMPIEPVPIPKPDFADNEQLKQAYGIALGRDLEPFPAGLELFPDQTPKALWVSVHWVNDPTVIGSRDGYKKALKAQEKPLDKEELLSEVLLTARKAFEDKDKAALLKLYAEIAGFTGKQAETINNNSFSNNSMKITFVRAENKDAPKVIEASNSKSKIQNEELPIKLKLVGGSHR